MDYPADHRTVNCILLCKLASGTGRGGEPTAKDPTFIRITHSKPLSVASCGTVRTSSMVRRHAFRAFFDCAVVEEIQEERDTSICTVGTLSCSLYSVGMVSKSNLRVDL